MLSSRFASSIFIPAIATSWADGVDSTATIVRGADRSSNCRALLFQPWVKYERLLTRIFVCNGTWDQEQGWAAGQLHSYNLLGRRSVGAPTGAGARTSVHKLVHAHVGTRTRAGVCAPICAHLSTQASACRHTNTQTRRRACHRDHMRKNMHTAQTSAP
eukprot:6182890-Pleurochrysis_carterae.AAC.5